MRYRVLGPVAMLPRTPTAAKLRVLLATLLVRAGQVVPSETLVDELWGDRPPRTVTTTLQVYVSQLRTLLAEGRPVPGARDDLLQTRPPGYRLQVGPGELDLTVFEEQVRDGRQAYDAGRHEEAAERLHEGLAQWRGAALSGVPHGPVLSAAAVHLEEARLAALDLRIAADLRCGRHVQLTAELVALAAEHPYRESLHAHLMVALYRSERQTDALAAYRRLRDALVDELGVEPGPGLSRLHERILRSDPALDWRPSSAGGRAPQLWLPAGPAELLGRERATTAALRMLSGDAENPPARVLGISGRAGIGKTAFALDLARRWAEHLPDGQVLVPLRGPGGEPLNAAAVAAAVLRRLGHEVPQGGSPERELTARLRGLRLLLLLDDASAEQQVRPVADALADGLLLLTSRRTLVGLQGARHLVLDVLTAAESLRLLLAEGGTGAAADPAAAREIVRICGRLPLALRVAGATLAARPHWTAADLAERLGAAATPLDLLSAGDMDLRSVLAVGYRELAAPERRAFRLLSLTPESGFAAWTAGVLLHTSTEQAERSLELLADARMVEVSGQETGHRYHYHRLLRSLARELLLAEEPVEQREAAARRLGGALLLVARRASDQLLPGRVSDWPEPPGTGVPVSLDASRIIGRTPARWFQEEADSLLHAARQAHQAHDWCLAWQLADALTPYLEAAGRWQEWQDVLDLGLDAADRDDSSHARARLLASRGELAWQRLRTGAARAHFATARALFERLDDPSGVIRCLVGAGDAALSEGDADRAATNYAAALDHAAQAHDARAAADARRGIALTEVLAGRPEDALRTFQEFTEAAEQLGDQRWVRLGQRNADRMLEHLVDWYAHAEVHTPPALEARPGVWLVHSAAIA